MTARSHMRGNPIEFVKGRWKYPDGSPADDSWPCFRCGRKATPEGYDACLGKLPGVRSACCGHGVTGPIELKGGSK